MALIVIGTIMVTIPLPAQAASEPVYFYADDDGYPSASLKTTAPTYSGPMLDIDHNGKEGRRVDRSDHGLSETDNRKYQQWTIDASGLQVTGSATVTIWFADKSFNGGDDNRLVGYLLDCGSSGCFSLASASRDVAVPDGENVFQQTTLTFPSFDHTFGPGRSLRLRMMVDKNFSDDDMTFAYDTTSYVTRLKMNKVVPPPTTTSTTTTVTTTTTLPTTTTTKPSPTTTSMSSPSSTLPANTTTSVPGGTIGSTTPTGSTTSTSTASTSTTMATTTTTRVFGSATTPTVPPGPPPPPELQDLDTEKVALVVRTTPAQRGIRIDAPSVELDPVEGLMVTFVTAAETVRRNLASAAGLGLVMAILSLIGMSRRTTEDHHDST